MNLGTIDWIIIILFFVITMTIGLLVSKRAGRSAEDFFLSGRNMPWWLLGVSMVATTFSADTPNLVTDIVRQNGIAGNWVWWAFLLTGMTTVFIYAKLWRRSGITTDLEFYELRYSGPAATFLRGFRAIYLGVFFNVMIMATVLLAGIKIGGVMLGLSAIQTVLLVSIVTVVYSSLGGLRGVILTDFFQFFLSMIGMIAAAIYIVDLPEVGGLPKLFNHVNVADKLDFVPDLSDPAVALPFFFIPLAVQWWSVWYPGAEPGGGGYIAQRMLSAKNENDAIKATLFFNLAHYALRPWPWILIALASLIFYPDLASLQTSFPNIEESKLGHDLAFSAMLTKLPVGLLGLVVAALIAALMSTISTHLNWGASYIVNDWYVRFIDKGASPKNQVNIGRLSTLVLMIASVIVALYLQDAMQAFDIILQIGAGTGLLFILRWFWWRINAYSEIVAMIISFVVACIMEFAVQDALLDYQKLVIGVGITTVAWLLTTLVTRPTNMKTLKSFFMLIHPHAAGWKPVVANLSDTETKSIRKGHKFTSELLMLFLGCVFIYAFLFGTGYLLYGEGLRAFVCLGVGAISSFVVYKLFTNVKATSH